MKSLGPKQSAKIILVPRASRPRAFSLGHTEPEVQENFLKQFLKRMLELGCFSTRNNVQSELRKNKVFQC